MKNLNQFILQKEAQDFIIENLKADISKLIFKGSPIKEISIQELVEQIEAKKKCQHKLPTWFETENIYYPNKLNIEQTSSEITALYKANLLSGNSIMDLTGGFGVDSYYFSKQFQNATYCEINTELSKIVQHNYIKLGVENIDIKAQDGLVYLESQESSFDWIYMDPSRRNDQKGKVFLLKDCVPNVPENLNRLLEKSNNILIKVSPMLDITSTIKELVYVKDVHIIAVNNEVKELLFVLEKSYTGTVTLKTEDISVHGIQKFDALYKEQYIPSFSLPKNFLYEPNAAILKAGLFNEVVKLGVDKLQQNSHLYTSDTLLDFPGRRFQIEHCIPYDKKQLKKLIPTLKANITTRNFPETVAQIRTKTGFKDGGDYYLFFTTLLNKKHVVLICTKV